MSKLAFIAVPKCASMATKHFCDANQIAFHNHYHDYRKWISETDSRMKADELFAIIRDPVDRVLSAYHYLKQAGRNHMDGYDWQRFCYGFESFGDFIEFGLEPASRNQLHFMPQWFWIFPPGQEVDDGKLTLLRFANLQADLREFALNRGLKFEGIPHRNRSNREGAIVTPEQEAMIRHIYARDCEILDAIS